MSTEIGERVLGTMIQTRSAAATAAAAMVKNEAMSAKGSGGGTGYAAPDGEFRESRSMAMGDPAFDLRA